MITGWTIYWVTRLDNITMISGFVAFFGILLGVLGTAITLSILDTLEDDNAKEYAKKAWSIAKKFLMAGTIGLVVYFATPTTKEGAAMLIVPSIVNDERVQELPSNLLDLSNAWIKEQTANLSRPVVVKKEGK